MQDTASYEVTAGRPPRIFYGWWIVAGGAGVMAMSAGLNFYGFAAFFVPLSEQFGWSRGVLSGVFSLSRLEGGLLGPVEGFLVDKFGPRRMMLIGIPVMGVGFMLLSQVNSLLSLYLVYILTITFGSSIGTFAPVGAAVANWFNRKRSRAIGFVMAGVAVGGAVFLPILGWLITAYSWRHAAFVSGLIVIGGGMPVALLMRHKPEQYGLYPDGIAPVVSQDGDGQDGQAVSTPEEVEIGGKQSLKTPAFWFLGLSSALRSIVTTGLTIHFVAMMVDRGFSLTMASTLLGSVALLSIIGRLGLAWLGDILDKRFLLAATMWLMGFSMLGLSQVEATWAVLAMLLVYAIAYGGAIVLPLALQADYFGRRSFATIRGLMQSVQTGGMLVGPVLAGFAYDATESYFMAFVGFGIAALLAGFLVIGIRRPTKTWR